VVQIGSHLLQRLPVIGSDEMTVPTGGAADEVAAEVIDGDLVGAEGLNVGAGAVREAGDLAEGDALGLDLVEGLAAVEHGLVEPPPGSLPAAAGVDGERVEDDDEGGEAAEGRLGLRLEAGGEAEEALHGAALEGLREEALAVRRGEVHRRRRREDPPVQGRHRRHTPALDALSPARRDIAVDAALIRPCRHSAANANANSNSNCTGISSPLRFSSLVFGWQDSIFSRLIVFFFLFSHCKHM